MFSTLLIYGNFADPESAPGWADQPSSSTVGCRPENVKKWWPGSRTAGCPCSSLSLKAGGVGLNLTKATHVIHYDRWWGAVEDRAWTGDLSDSQLAARF
jgi:hypothetical protein